MINVGKIKAWANKEVAPMAWYRVALRLSPEFKKRKIYTYLLDDTMLDDEMVIMANETFYKVFKKQIPQYLLKK